MGQVLEGIVGVRGIRRALMESLLRRAVEVAAAHAVGGGAIPAAHGEGRVLAEMESIWEHAGQRLGLGRKATLGEVASELIDRDQRPLAKELSAANKARRVVAHPPVSLRRRVGAALRSEKACEGAETGSACNDVASVVGSTDASETSSREAARIAELEAQLVGVAAVEAQLATAQEKLQQMAELEAQLEDFGLKVGAAEARAEAAAKQAEQDEQGTAAAIAVLQQQLRAEQAAKAVEVEERQRAETLATEALAAASSAAAMADAALAEAREAEPGPAKGRRQWRGDG